MRTEPGSFILILLGIATGVFALWVMLFDRYTYYDYKPGECRVSGVVLQARLTGDFASRQPATRGSPYRLSIDVSNTLPGDSLEDVTLTPEDISARPVTPLLKRYDREPSDTSGKAFHLMSDPLPLAFESYTLTGTLRREPNSPEQLRFSCEIDRKYRSEWRAPWLDAWMSV